ncbi:MAG: septum site-determining protein MinD, partial [Lysinibacillus sp.]
QHLMKNGEALDVNEITTHLSIDLLGIIADSEDVISSSNKGEPIVMDPTNKASLGYRNIARRILGESVPLMSMDEERKGMFSKIKSLFAK